MPTDRGEPSPSDRTSVGQPGSAPTAAAGRSGHIYRAVARQAADGDPFDRLRAVCHACVDLLPVSGAGVMLVADRTHLGTAYATDPLIRQLEDLQNAAREGPCIDAYNLGRPVLEPDLAGPGVRAWPELANAALSAGMGALFGFPLQLDDTSVGALDLYSSRPGGLSPDQVVDGRLLAAMAAREVLAMQAAARPGSLPARIADLSGDRVAIEQATGMVAAQLDVSVALAAERLRAEARAERRALAAVARDVVARRLRPA